MHDVVVGFAFRVEKNPKHQTEYPFEIVNHEKEGYLPSFAWIPVNWTIEITITLFMIN